MMMYMPWAKARNTYGGLSVNMLIPIVTDLIEIALSAIDVRMTEIHTAEGVGDHRRGMMKKGSVADEQQIVLVACHTRVCVERKAARNSRVFNPH
jgi:hypothetical protein